MITNFSKVNTAIVLRPGDVLAADLCDNRGVPLLVRGSTLSFDLVRKIRDRAREGKVTFPIVLANVERSSLPVAVPA